MSAPEAEAAGLTAERPHVVSVVYDFQRRAIHTCLVCHFAGFYAPPLPCPGPAAGQRRDLAVAEADLRAALDTATSEDM